MDLSQQMLNYEDISEDLLDEQVQSSQVRISTNITSNMEKKSFGSKDKIYPKQLGYSQLDTVVVRPRSISDIWKRKKLEKKFCFKNDQDKPLASSKDAFFRFKTADNLNNKSLKCSISSLLKVCVEIRKREQEVSVKDIPKPISFESSQMNPDCLDLTMRDVRGSQ